MIFGMTAVLIDAWLAVAQAGPVRMVAAGAARAWRRLPGDAIGWLVVRGCGIGAPTREVAGAGRMVAVVEDRRIGRWFELNLIPVQAQTLGRYVIAREPISDETFEHELEHVRQWSRLGPLYLPLYFGSSAIAFLRGRRPYWDNPFEAAARRRASQEMAARRGRDTPTGIDP